MLYNDFNISNGQCDGESSLNTGDIVSSVISKYPYFVHRGVVLKKDNCTFVAHNTKLNKNKYGGSIVLHSISDWKKRGIFSSVHKSDLTEKEIENYIDDNKYKHFDWITYNCEHFTNDLQYNIPISQQVIANAFVAFVAILIGKSIFYDK